MTAKEKIKQQVIQYVDIKTVITVLTTVVIVVCFIKSLESKVNVLANDIKHYETVAKDVQTMRDSLTRIEVLVEEYVKPKNR